MYHGSAFRHRRNRNRLEKRLERRTSETLPQDHHRLVRARTSSDWTWVQRQCRLSSGRDSSRGTRSTDTWLCPHSGGRWRQLLASVAPRSNRYPCLPNWIFATASHWLPPENLKQNFTFKKYSQNDALVTKLTCTGRLGCRAARSAWTRRVADNQYCRQTGYWPTEDLRVCTLPVRTWRRAG